MSAPASVAAIQGRIAEIGTRVSMLTYSARTAPAGSMTSTVGAPAGSAVSAVSAASTTGSTFASALASADLTTTTGGGAVIGAAPPPIRRASCRETVSRLV